jgi:hypothetical protein
MKYKLALILLLSFTLSSCELLKQLEIPSTLPVNQPLTEGEITSGLKEALRVGTTKAVSNLSQKGGFMNSEFKIPFPPEVKIVEDKLRQFGFGNLADQFIAKLNEGAEEAVKEAAPIFADAILAMTITDAKNILIGPSNAATEYFRSKTSEALFNAFRPKVQTTLDKVGLTQLWFDVMSTYNSIPLVKKVETDLPKYVTNKSMDALFVKIAQEELQIRQDPAARISAILQRVFGYKA